jgi:hypothetical protein
LGAKAIILILQTHLQTLFPLFCFITDPVIALPNA